MDSAIRLYYSPLPTAPRRLKPGAAATSRASGVNLSSSHGFLSVSHCSKRSHLVSRPLHVNCMHERFSEGSKKKENDKKIVRGMGGVSLVLACVLGAFSLSSKMNPRSYAAYALCAKQNVMSLNVLESLMELIKPEALSHFKKEPNEDDAEALKLCAMAISSYGHGDQARKILSDEYEIWKEHSASGEYLKMALIEFLLSQRDYQKANEELDELIYLEVGVGKEEDYEKKIKELQDIGIGPMTKKIFEYKALVNDMLKKEEAKAWKTGLDGLAAETQPRDIPIHVENE